MFVRAVSLLIIAVLTLTWSVGCAAPRTAADGRRPPGVGQTESMREIVRRVNENNGRIPTLWAGQDIEASIVDDKGKVRNEIMSGAVLYRAPNEMLMVGTKDPVGRVFELGTNGEVYWMSIRVGEDTAWWGRYEHLGKPCAEPIPIRPDLVMEVLGVSQIDEDFLSLPAPTMRFNPDSDAYMFVWHAPLHDRWVAVKEVWYDRQTLYPTLVLLFDENGRVVLRAYLANHRKVRVDNLPESEWPTVATHYRLYFPDTGSRMTIRFVETALSQRGAPNDRSFRFSPDRAGVANVIQLDEACGL